MMTTAHRGKIVFTGRQNRRHEEVSKPDCILAYNDNMCGVDRSDQLTAYYPPLRKTLKWYKKVILHMLDLAVTNSYLLYISL